MAKKVRKTNSKPNKKGTVKNPYTVEEHEQMLAAGQWTEDGFVEELGLVEGEGDSLNGNGDGYGNYINNEDDNPDFKKVADGECIIGAIYNAAQLLGMDIKYKKIKKDLRSYYNAELNRYEVGNEELSSILDMYFSRTSEGRAYLLANHLRDGKPVIVQEIKDDKPTLRQLHDLLLYGIASDNSSYLCYDTVTGAYSNLTTQELEDPNKYIQSFYKLDQIH